MLKHLPCLFLFSLLTKVIVFGASTGDALALIALSSLYGFHLHLESKKEVPANKTILEKLSFLEEQYRLSSAKVAALQIQNTRR